MRLGNLNDSHTSNEKKRFAQNKAFLRIIEHTLTELLSDIVAPFQRQCEPPKDAVTSSFGPFLLRGSIFQFSGAEQKVYEPYFRRCTPIGAHRVLFVLA